MRTTTSSRRQPGAPSKTASTVPSVVFLAQPETPRSSASLRSESRKKTPCTLPWITTLASRAVGYVRCPDPPVRRNTLLLSASLAANSAMLQLSAAVATLTVVLVVGVRSLVGLGPAIVLGTGALSALPAGRAMDRFGRVPVLVDRLRARRSQVECWPRSARLSTSRSPFSSGSPSWALRARPRSSRAPPPETCTRRAAGRGVSRLSSSAPSSARFSGRPSSARSWRAATSTPTRSSSPGSPPRRSCSSGSCSSPRCDPTRAGSPACSPGRTRGGRARGQSRGLAVILRRPGVLPSMVAAMASFSTMVVIMTLTGVVVVDRGHPGRRRLPDHRRARARHVRARDRRRRPHRPDRTHAARSSAGSRSWPRRRSACSGSRSVATIALALFALGLGWSFSFVAATAQLADCTIPAERGKLLGLNDLLSGPHRCGARPDRRLRARCARGRRARRSVGWRSRSPRRGGSCATRSAFAQPRSRRPRSTDGWYNRPSADARSAAFLS